MRMIDPRRDLSLALGDLQIARFEGQDFGCAFRNDFVEIDDIASRAPVATMVGTTTGPSSARVVSKSGASVTLSVGDSIEWIDVFSDDRRGPYVVRQIEPRGHATVRLILEASE